MTRTLLEITGADREAFLQGLITNDVARAKEGLVYAALLTPQGKYLADFFVLAEGDALLVDVAADLADGLAQRLNMYRLRADVEIAVTGRSVARGTGPAPEGAVADPRHPALGWRDYTGTHVSDNTDWDALRVAHLVPQTGAELTPESYILEMRFEALNGVDFRKGCYVGQEVTARMKHKTELRKGLAQVAIAGAAAEGAEITTDGKPVGTLLTRVGDKALAYLRFDRAAVAGDMRAGDATISLRARG